MDLARPAGADESLTVDERGQLLPRLAQAVHTFLVRIVDCCRPLLPSSRHSLRGIEQVCLGRGPDRIERLRARGQAMLRIELRDPRISSAHARLRHEAHGWVIEDARSKNGTLVGGRAVSEATLSDGDVIQVGRTFFLFRQVVGSPTPDDDTDSDVEAPPPICGLSTFHEPLSRALSALETIARSSLPVVIHGETGTGKEVVARGLHGASGRDGDFVAVNCGALPETLVQSELYGVRRGAFSDAREDRLGVVRSAHRGTLFLDEIGDLRLPLQAAFLRVLQEREVTPLGHARPLPVDFRLVTATHRSLQAMTARGTFREDLWSRIAGFTLQLPALRGRREDLGILIPSMVRRFAVDPDAVTFDPSAMHLLLEHRWPQNVRELEKRLATALALVGRGQVEPAHLGDLPHLVRSPSVVHRNGSVDELQRNRLVSLLAEHRGNITLVARAIGKDRTQVRRWMRKLGLDPLTYRS